MHSFAHDFSGFDVVAFSTPSSMTYPLVRQSRFVSRYDQDTLVIAGGVHASMYPAQTLLDLKVDALCVGEGDLTMREILERAHTRDFSKIPGICYPSSSGPVFTEPRKLLEDINDLPYPARHLLPVDDLIMSNRLATTDLRMTHIMFSRGCPYSCYFCAAPQKKVQYRTGENIRRELETLIAQYQISGFSIVDDNSIINKENLSEICDSITDLNLKWITVSRVDTITVQVLRAMKKAGCIEIAFGVESGSDAILAAMNKRISTKDIVDAIELTHSMGIGVKVFLIHGFPGENGQTTQQTIDLLRIVADKIQRISLFRFVPLPGSFVYRNHKQFDLHIDDDGDYSSVDWSRYHIHHNNYHWWGSQQDFATMNLAFNELRSFIQSKWPSRFE
ncbi:MAG: B12-binding domain-containing radical SAM protein [Candidatus Kapabacteria bacterium]|nr:B12-binding domain-containing radical SAM protein [Candidatus Kapabacteria bacterium]